MGVTVHVFVPNRSVQDVRFGTAVNRMNNNHQGINCDALAACAIFSFAGILIAYQLILNHGLQLFNHGLSSRHHHSLVSPVTLPLYTHLALHTVQSITLSAPALRQLVLLSLSQSTTTLFILSYHSVYYFTEHYATPLFLCLHSHCAFSN